MANGTTTPDQLVASAAASEPNWFRRHLPQPGSNGFLTLCSVVALLILWQVVSMLAGRTSVSNERYVPNVVDIAGAFNTLAYYWKGGLGVEATTDGGAVTFAGAVLGLISNSLATMARLAIGMTLGFIVAGLAAGLICWSSFLRKIFLLPANAARMLPLLAMSPLFGIWFGKSEVGATLFIAFATFAIIFVVALTAIDTVPGYYGQYARSLGAGKLRAYVTGVLPAALPGLRGGVMLALGFGWSMVIAAEFIGQDLGLGNIVNRAQEFGRTDTLGVLGIFIVAYAWVSYKLTAKAFDYITRWAE
ncbi:MAG: ABC transporter permease subunit [Solirubrobacteraceae bacterium]|nr:ABC transporter permease subunit [Solirubrobacteraceae bacterium]